MTTERLLISLIAFTLVTCWIGAQCSARPEHDRTIANEGNVYVENRADETEHGDDWSNKFGVKLRDEDDETTIEDFRQVAEPETNGEPETIVAKEESFKSARNLRDLQHYSYKYIPNSKAAIPSTRTYPVSARVLRRKLPDTDEKDATRARDNAEAEDLGKFVESILEDAKTLMQHAETFLAVLKIAIDNASQIECPDCSVSLAEITNEYDKTRTTIGDFIARGHEISERLTNESQNGIVAIAEIKESSALPSETNVVACVTRLKRRLDKLVRLARECMSRREDTSQASLAENIVETIASVEPYALENLEELVTRDTHRDNVHWKLPETTRSYRKSSGYSSAVSYYGDPAFSPSSSSAKTASSGPDDYHNEKLIASEIVARIEAFKSLLNFLRKLPDILSELLGLVDTTCNSKMIEEDLKPLRKIVAPPLPPPVFMELPTTTRRPAAAHKAPTKYMTLPYNDSARKPEDTSSTRERDDSDRRNNEVKSNELVGSRHLMYEDNLPDVPMSRPEAHQPRDPNEFERNVGMYPRWDSFDAWGPWTTGWSTGDAIGQRFLPYRSPHCFYVNTIRYEGPVNSYGVSTPNDLHSSQRYAGSIPIPRDTGILGNDDFSHIHPDVRHTVLPTIREPPRRPVHFHSYHLKLALRDDFVTLIPDIVKSGDFLVLSLGKCSLVGNYHQRASYVDFKLFERPLVFFNTTGDGKRIWQIPLRNFEDMIGPDTLNNLRWECERRAPAPPRRYRYVRATAKCAENL